MRKVWVVARREYRAAVRTKAFIASIVLMPALMFGSIGVQVLFKKLEDTGEKKFAVVDRTSRTTVIEMYRLEPKLRTNVNTPEPSVSWCAGKVANASTVIGV